MSASHFKWYIVHIYSGFEKKVAEDIKANVERAKLNDFLKEIYVPKEKVSLIVRGKRVVTEKNSFPGYILVQADLVDELFSVIKNTNRVTNFLTTTAGKPKVIPDREVDDIKSRCQESFEKEITDAFEVGEIVKINKDPFSDFNGTIKSIENNGEKIKVEVTIFGRPLIVDVEPENIKRIEGA